MKSTKVPASAAGRSLLSLLLCATFLLAIATLAPALPAVADSAQDERADLHQALLDLSNPWTVMCLAAHPDDEDGATLTLLRRKYGVHTVTVFSTFGEGGQNAVGPELYEELGAIRARETLAAAEIQGSEAWFLALRDFGFSKSAAEAFRVWGHDEALRRMVLKIRTLHPDVIITNHDTLSGHGHHQATGRLALEAFDASADARRFPEQLHDPGVTLWQPQRLFVRINYEEGTGSRDLEQAAEREGKVIVINPNERDAVRGKTYAEQALAALHQHASQGPWPQAVPEKGAPVIRYRLAREAKDAAPLPHNAETFLTDLRLSEKIADKMIPPTIAGRPLTDFVDERQRLLDALIVLRKERLQNSLFSIFDAPRFQLMSERLDRALALASNIHLTLKPERDVLVPNSQSAFAINISNQGGIEARLLRVALSEPARRNPRLPDHSQRLIAPQQLKPHASVNLTTAEFTPGNAWPNVPHAAHLYDGRLFGRRIKANAEVEINGATFSLHDEARVDVAPAVEIASIAPSPIVLTPATAGTPFNLTFTFVNHQRKPFRGALVEHKLKRLGSSEDGQLDIAADQSRRVTLPFLLPPMNRRGNQGGNNIDADDVAFSLVRLAARAPVSQRTVKVVYADARAVPRLRVGYVRSFDDTLRNALAALGVEAKELTIDDVRAGELQNFDTIIIDNRGYQAHPELIAANERLLEYARSGGTLIVFYHKANEWNPDPKKNRPQLAPYPLKLGTARVTEEVAPIAFTEPQSALLNFPNKIEARDFDGWIQERGLYYPQEWDAHYSAPLAMSDAGEPELRGGLLATDYGRGRYIYTSMVWYRQLRAGVPGAYRLFANMISYGHQR